MSIIEKDFDCVEMKNAIQAKIYAARKDMKFEEYKAYLNRRLKKRALLARMQRRQEGMNRLEIYDGL
jgi:hypothetical protein